MTIYLNNRLVVPKVFPDGTPKLDIKHFSPIFNMDNNILWLYEPNEEMTLYYIVKHLRDYDSSAKINLSMPYLPNARMDRVKSEEEVFTLKWFAEFINSLNFGKVILTDVHSNVGEALIDRIVIDTFSLEVFHKNAIDKFNPDVIFFPDAGAHKRYADNLAFKQYPSTFGNKVRDWKTGEIKGLTIDTPGMIDNKRVLIVDDICSFGGTFSRSVDQLEEAGATAVALAVTHCEDNILKGGLLKEELLEAVYTTDSLYKAHSDKVKVVFEFAPQVK